MSMNILLNLLLFSRELLEQVAEFEKAEFTSSNKKVIFILNLYLFLHVWLCIHLHACLCIYGCPCAQLLVHMFVLAYGGQILMQYLL